VYHDPDEMAAAAATIFGQMASRCVKENGCFRVALAGGNTPRAVHREIATRQQSGAQRLPWDKIQVFFGDERCVPPDSDQSNFVMARDTLLSRVPIPPGNVHRFQGELPPAQAALDYHTRLQQAFATSSHAFPRFDLVFLGLGEDGHTASLFPETAALQETRWLAVANEVPKLGAWRLTLTLPVFNHAACVLFLAAGASKAPIVRQILRPHPTSQTLPAQLVQPATGWLRWFLDEAAAAQLA
jgi:6-phosphogluconolactonase